MDAKSLVFATYAESVEGVHDACRLAESVRTFAGGFSQSSVWLYIPQGLAIDSPVLLQRLPALGVELRTCHTPERAGWLYYSGKVYAAAAAEAAASGEVAVLVWMDSDSIVLTEPTAFDLNDRISFAYCPVMHNRSGSLFAEPPDAFWSRIYERLMITEEMLFPMITPADQQKIRAYFQAGLLVVRPEQGILRRWPEDFELLYTDPMLAGMCKTDENKRIFLHQAALVGAVLHSVAKDEMIELSDRYNYPIFFEKQYVATEAYNTIEDVVTIRCVVSPKYLATDWHKELAGPRDRVSWLKERLGRQ